VDQKAKDMDNARIERATFSMLSRRYTTKPIAHYYQIWSERAIITASSLTFFSGDPRSQASQ
jgi:hypothetical protein